MSFVRIYNFPFSQGDGHAKRLIDLIDRRAEQIVDQKMRNGPSYSWYKPPSGAAGGQNDDQKSISKADVEDASDNPAEITSGVKSSIEDFSARIYALESSVDRIERKTSEVLQRCDQIEQTQTSLKASLNQALKNPNSDSNLQESNQFSKILNYQNVCEMIAL